MPRSNRYRETDPYEINQLYFHFYNKVIMLNSTRSKKKRVVYLNEMSNISVLLSDVATALEMTQEVKLKSKEIKIRHERLRNLNVEINE